MRIAIYWIMCVLMISSCNAQSPKEADKYVGGRCEGCEAIFEYGNKVLTSIDTLPDYHSTSPRLKITGIVYQKDRKTPAENVMLYIYHTNRDGIYLSKGEEKAWGKRHGYLRGWIKTGKDGRYTFYTIRPAAYPNGIAPEHIHLTVKEPGLSAYYMDDFVFEDDPMLTLEERKKMINRGGSGIVTPINKDGIYLIQRDIILGLNIPNYE